MGYKSIGKFEVQEVLELIKSPQGVVMIQGHKVRVNGSRLMNFVVNGTDCICCGAKGSYFSLESNGGGYHFNLYAKHKHDKDVLMTRDHIKLKCKGGPDTVDNYNPMCEICNKARGCMYENLEDFLKAYHNNTLVSRREFDRLNAGISVDNLPDSEKSFEELGSRQRRNLIRKWKVQSCYSHVSLYWKFGYGKTNEEHF